jgi:Zn-dependent protease
LFRLAGTDVFVHWSWFVAAYVLIQDRPVPYSSLAWDAAEYVAGFGLVLLHEFGHVLACRRVGGTADRVVLWPLGGLAFVAPPPRPGADFWTTAAGPLVNVVLAPALALLSSLTAPGGEDEIPSDLHHLFAALAWFNVVMLVFNLLPIYPLDGGRLLQATLWRWLGRAPALAIAAGVGVAAGAGLGVLALAAGAWWLAVTMGFLVLGALGGVSQARLITRLEKVERRPGLACPNCGAAPPVGPFWRCARCLGQFDLFDPVAGCPKGGAHATDGACPGCGRPLAPADWVPPAAGGSGDRRPAEPATPDPAP